MTFTLSCEVGTGQGCAGTVSLASHEQTDGSQGLALSARAHKRKAKVKLITDATARYSIRPGHTIKITLTLNRTARKLLKRFHRLPTTLHIPGTAAQRVTFNVKKTLHHRAHKR